MLADWLELPPGAQLALLGYLVTMALLALFGVHRYSLVWRARRASLVPLPALAKQPSVTVQLPLYNELHVAPRLVRAVGQLVWPRDRLEVQVLDDSDDETSTAVAAVVAELRDEGLNVSHIRRASRHGFKAGALANGLLSASGEFIAVFDADFVPPPSFLLGLLPYFDTPTIGMVQARWGHLNREASLLTRLQATFLDGHFLVDQPARSASGCFFNFNGTAGVWRKRAIVDAGGWTSHTVTEDLDLSYRAQLRGWRFAFVPQMVVPAELPADINAFKSQQHRWARGSAQTARRILPSLLRAPLPTRVKLEALFHLTSNSAYVLLLALALLSGPVLAARRGFGWEQTLILDLPFCLLGVASVLTFYAGPRELGAGPGSRLRQLGLLPALMAVGVGIAVNNTRAVVSGLFGDAGEFRRTPKAGDSARGRYAVGPHAWVVVELGLGLHLARVATTAATSGQWLSLPFLLLFSVGFLGTALVSLASLAPRAAAALGAARAPRYP